MIYTAHSQKKRTQIVHSVNTRTQKLVDHLNEHDWGLFTSSYGKLPMKNDMAVRDLNYAVIEGLSSWTGKSATIEDARKISAPVIAAMKKWAHHGANDFDAWAELGGILRSIGFTADTVG